MCKSHLYLHVKYVTSSVTCLHTMLYIIQTLQTRLKWAKQLKSEQFQCANFVNEDLYEKIQL